MLARPSDDWMKSPARGATNQDRREPFDIYQSQKDAMAKKKRFPDPLEVDKCLRLRKCSKVGVQLSKEESEFCISMMKRFPKWYAVADVIVFNETVPFGSNVSYPVPEYKGE